MKLFSIIIVLMLFSCSTPEPMKYVPQEAVSTDVLTTLINNERSRLNLNELKAESLLIELSKQKAIQMEDAKEINHDGFTQLQTNAETFAQIVGCGYRTENDLLNAYMNSETHKNIVLGNFTHIGSFTYKNYNCVIFAKY